MLRVLFLLLAIFLAASVSPAAPADSASWTHLEDPAWSPDGKQLLVSSSRGAAGGAGEANRVLWSVPPHGGVPRQLTRGIGRDPDRGWLVETGDRNPTWSPDLTRFAFSRLSLLRIGSRYYRHSLFVAKATGDEARAVIDGVHEVAGWTDADTLLAAVPVSGTADAPPRAWELRRYHLDTNEKETLRLVKGGVTGLWLAPDRRHLLLAAQLPSPKQRLEDRPPTLSLLDQEGNELRRLCPELQFPFALAWAPVSARFAVTLPAADPPGGHHVWVVELTGSRRQLTRRPHQIETLGWGTGGRIRFTARHPSSRPVDRRLEPAEEIRFYSVSPAGGDGRLESRVRAPVRVAWSPDGNHAAYVQDQTLQVLDLTTRRTRRLLPR